MKHIKIEFKWAIIFTIAMLLWMLFEKTLGWHDEKIADHYWLTLLFFPIGIFMTVLVMREKRRRMYRGKLTWMQGFLTGLKMSVFVALLSPLAQYITHNYITPEYFNNVIDYSVTNDLMTMKKANEVFNFNSYMLQSFFGALIGGIITSAIVAIFMRRK
ncbi:DUF4199 domain-containing protein [Cochleicola gelatinilyticus]|uniref:DUF4199 domain-containing protein n=1 Tax=Cochleicola gelatinilyticus TaxID=1763537 RepID=A0A167EQ13_9FLAO|nr:DUF4199 domain-containing protein [Cochleicola gelatinilyticus]OAB75761.1 hypothetical protein ULVI_14900 [Cochleicola gelatinilyticus]